MARFKVVPASNIHYAPRWGIEEVVPGEKPIPVPFYGTRAEAEDEASRLNLYGRKAEQTPMATKRAPRPRDPIQLGKLMVDIATGQVPDTIEDGKDAGAASMGRKGGAARAARMTPEERSEAARKAVAKRWGKSQ